MANESRTGIGGVETMPVPTQQGQHARPNDMIKEDEPPHPVLVDFVTEYSRVKPQDLLQFGADYFNARLALERRKLIVQPGQQPFGFPITPLQHPPTPPHQQTYHFAPLAGSNGFSHGQTPSMLGDAYTHNTTTDDDITEGVDDIDADFATDSSEDEEEEYIPPPPNTRGRRFSVSAESMTPSAQDEKWEKVFIHKSDEHRSRIAAAVAQNLLFRNLDESQYKDVVDAMAEKIFTKDEVVIQQGAVGDFFYVVDDGELECYINKDGGQMKVAHYTTGGSFGELALMYNAPRAATVIARSDRTALWALDRVTFRKILMESTSRKRRMYEGFLEEVPLLATLEPYERFKIADALETKVFEQGDVVVKQGDMGDNFYIIERGNATVQKVDKEGKTHEMTGLKKGDYFGELALLGDRPRAATIIAEDRLTAVTLNKRAFNRLLGPITDLMRRNITRYQRLPGEKLPARES